ncbi:Aldo/keto reductase [Macrolepiota fuliginosa MF-IS2]|uniref:Aldo/keto reductase n=1 Tax=Macrolepiota fuliginosa MF-IS2 TaxID=1400762 RepID=A0A9P5XKT4_9AGAR|nr:Aldo/keto reductase [Macrolepiota fuliginosa MF-IS2]
MSKLTLQSTYTLSDGEKLPVLGFGALGQGDAKTAVAEALKAGYRQIDGAQMYENEDQCGAAIRESGIPRNEIFTTSKISSEHRGHGYDTVIKGVDESLQTWGHDYIDLYLIHDPLKKDLRLESYKALVDAKKAGKVKSIGVSNYGVKHLEEIKNAGYPLPVVNQIELHPYLQQREIAAYCKENGIIVQAYCPIIRGATDTTIDEIAKKHNKEPAQVLIRWSLQKGYVPLPKSGTPSRIQSNTNVFDFELSEEDIAKLDGLEKGKACSWNPVNAD